MHALSGKSSDVPFHMANMGAICERVLILYIDHHTKVICTISLGRDQKFSTSLLTC